MNIISQITELQEAAQKAQDKVDKIDQEIAGLSAQINKAHDRAQTLRTDDTGSLDEVGKSLAEQAHIIEAGTLRKSRLEEKRKQALDEANLINRKAGDIKREALMYLPGYRREKRIKEISRYFSRWIDITKLADTRQTPMVQEAIYKIAEYDRTLDDFSRLSETETVAYIKKHIEEIKEAAEHEKARTERINRVGVGFQEARYPWLTISLTPQD